MRCLFILFIFISTNIFSQEDILAQEYFKNAEFEKALHEYKKLYANNVSNPNYINSLLSTYQQLEQYDEAETFLLKLMERMHFPHFYVELGYNYQLKDDLQKATSNYQKAIKSLDDNVNSVFSVARSFQSHSLLDEVIAIYEKAMILKPQLNFNLQLAQIYGEQGNIEKMFNSYITFIDSNPFVGSDSGALNTIKRTISDFISEDSSQENNILFRKILLKKMQQEPNILWNGLLSWLFIQQKEYNKSFIQEKAIFNRQPESLHRIEELARIVISENELDVAKDIYGFLTETAQDLDTKINAHNHLLKIETKESAKENYETIDLKYQAFFKEFGMFSSTLNVQIAYAHFLAFKMNDTNKAISFLEESLKLPLTELQKAEIKLELGDILVLQGNFNNALIYYTQIQRNLKNSTVSQEARFRVAKASYYKGDFKWAESQLKILKASTSQLIANDALELKLLISDNKYEDSLQTALKLYSKADLFAFQDRNDEAIALLDKILNEHKTEPIIAQALFKQAQLFETKKQFENAEKNYNRILLNYKDGILADNACYALAEIYANQLAQPEKAKSLYEQIIFEHADSVYFVEARKKFRALRGDAIN